MWKSIKIFILVFSVTVFFRATNALGQNEAAADKPKVSPYFASFSFDSRTQALTVNVAGRTNNIMYGNGTQSEPEAKTKSQVNSAGSWNSKSQTTSKKPVSTTKRPETTTKKPQTTTKRPETTSKKPVSTTKQPVTTTTQKYVPAVKSVVIEKTIQNANIASDTKKSINSQITQVSDFKTKDLVSDKVANARLLDVENVEKIIVKEESDDTDVVIDVKTIETVDIPVPNVNALEDSVSKTFKTEVIEASTKSPVKGATLPSSLFKNALSQKYGNRQYKLISRPKQPDTDTKADENNEEKIDNIIGRVIDIVSKTKADTSAQIQAVDAPLVRSKVSQKTVEKTEEVRGPARRPSIRRGGSKFRAGSETTESDSNTLITTERAQSSRRINPQGPSAVRQQITTKENISTDKPKFLSRKKIYKRPQEITATIKSEFVSTTEQAPVKIALKKEETPEKFVIVIDDDSHKTEFKEEMMSSTEEPKIITEPEIIISSTESTLGIIVAESPEKSEQETTKRLLPTIGGKANLQTTIFESSQEKIEEAPSTARIPTTSSAFQEKFTTFLSRRNRPKVVNAETDIESTGDRRIPGSETTSAPEVSTVLSKLNARRNRIRPGVKKVIQRVEATESEIDPPRPTAESFVSSTEAGRKLRPKLGRPRISYTTEATTSQSSNNEDQQTVTEPIVSALRKHIVKNRNRFRVPASTEQPTTVAIDSKSIQEKIRKKIIQKKIFTVPKPVIENNNTEDLEAKTNEPESNGNKISIKSESSNENGPEKIEEQGEHRFKITPVGKPDIKTSINQAILSKISTKPIVRKPIGARLSSTATATALKTPIVRTTEIPITTRKYKPKSTRKFNRLLLLNKNIERDDSEKVSNQEIQDSVQSESSDTENYANANSDSNLNAKHIHDEALDANIKLVNQIASDIQVIENSKTVEEEVKIQKEHETEEKLNVSPISVLRSQINEATQQKVESVVAENVKVIDAPIVTAAPKPKRKKLKKGYKTRTTTVPPQVEEIEEITQKPVLLDSVSAESELVNTQEVFQDSVQSENEGNSQITRVQSVQDPLAVKIEIFSENQEATTIKPIRKYSESGEDSSESDIRNFMTPAQILAKFNSEEVTERVPFVPKFKKNYKIKPAQKVENVEKQPSETIDIESESENTEKGKNDNEINLTLKLQSDDVESGFITENKEILRKVISEKQENSDVVQDVMDRLMKDNEEINKYSSGGNFEIVDDNKDSVISYKIIIDESQTEEEKAKLDDSEDLEIITLDAVDAETQKAIDKLTTKRSAGSQTLTTSHSEVLEYLVAPELEASTLSVSDFDNSIQEDISLKEKSILITKLAQGIPFNCRGNQQIGIRGKCRFVAY